MGGGNSAIEGALFLSRYAKTITIVHQFDNLQAEKNLQYEVLNHPKVTMVWDSEIRHAYGEDKLEEVLVENLKTKKTSKIKTDGIFVYIGMIPKTKMFENQVDIDKWGYIKAGETTETNVEGVFVAGDVREKLFRQLTTANADGTVAALMAERYIVNKRRKSNG